MSLKFFTKRRPGPECEHTSEVRLEIAGLNRSVCESCGRVSVAYVGDHFRSGRAQGLAVVNPDEVEPESDD